MQNILLHLRIFLPHRINKVALQAKQLSIDFSNDAGFFKISYLENDAAGFMKHDKLLTVDSSWFTVTAASLYCCELSTVNCQLIRKKHLRYARCSAIIIGYINNINPCLSTHTTEIISIPDCFSAVRLGLINNFAAD